MIKNILIIAVCCMAVNTMLRAQIIRTRLDVVTGLAYPEYAHFGGRYQYGDVGQIGFYYGSDMNATTSIIETWSIDHQYHFGKNSYTSNRPIWYGRTGLTYSVHSIADGTRYFSYAEFTAGRDFPVNDWLGFNMDMGLLFQFRERRTFHDGSDNNYDIGQYWKPAFRIQMYFSF